MGNLSRINQEQVLRLSTSTAVEEKKPQKRLKTETFRAGMTLLCSTLPNLVKEPERFLALEELLSDLTDEQFLRGVRVVCLEKEEIYPNTNLVAMIRNKGTARAFEERRHELLDLNWPPAPEDFEKIKQAKASGRKFLEGKWGKDF